MEKVNDEANYGQREFYLPHKAVIREKAESKLQIIYDSSARAKCYQRMIALQNIIWGILITTRSKSIVL